MSGQPLTTLGKIGAGMRGMIFAVPGLGLIAGAVSAIGAALATITAPVWAAIAAVVVTIAAAGYTIYKYWDRLSAVFSGVARRLGEELAPALALIRPLTDWLAGVGNTIARGWDYATTAVGAFIDKIMGFFGREVLSEEQKAAAEQSGYDFADRLISGIKAIPARVMAMASEMAAAGRELVAKLADGAIAKFDEFMVWVAEIPQRIIEAVGRIDLSNIITFPSLNPFGGGEPEVQPT